MYLTESIWLLITHGFYTIRLAIYYIQTSNNAKNFQSKYKLLKLFAKVLKYGGYGLIIIAYIVQFKGI